MFLIYLSAIAAIVAEAHEAPAMGAAVPIEPQATAMSDQALTTKTVVDIEIEDALSSKTNKIGDGFTIRLVEPLLVDGHVALAAGTTGRGEVIHAAKAGWGGKPGELIVMARYLECGGTRIPLGHFHFGASGRGRVGEAFVVTMVIPLGGLLVSGGDLIVPPRTRGTAQLTSDITLSGDAVNQCASTQRE